MADALNDADRAQLRERGISAEEFQAQIDCFGRGFAALDLMAPATRKSGVESLDAADSEALLARWAEAAQAGRLMKFVPASGAASRMFKTLLARSNDPTPLDAAALEAARAEGASGDAANDARFVARFFDQIDRFAFAWALRAVLVDAGHDADAILEGDGDRRIALELLFEREGLGYADLPKGLVMFHRDADGPRSAFEEQLAEALEVTVDGEDAVPARVHFTVAPDYRARIEAHCATAAAGHELSYSEQSPASDTVAVDLENRPLRDAQGRLVFRPGGHGALIGNLNALEGDIVFVKNIDNVVPSARREIVVRHQRLLAGLAVERQAQAHELWHGLADADSQALERVMEFVASKLHRAAPSVVTEGDDAARRDWLLDILARPLRVCAMVRNEGEPGGGPFWVRSVDGGASLQIVESSQIDHDDPEQERHFEGATHFNPVDLVCAVRDPQGRPHDLNRFVDPETGFISQKSKDGVELKALERPGLWNGAMAHWNTVFVEVPLETFNPVKTVNDLLRPAHQPS